MVSFDPVAAARWQAVKVMLVQWLMLTVMVLLVWWLQGQDWALSMLMGGAVGVLATAFMAWATLRHGIGTPAARVVWGFVLGWIMKILLTLGLLMAAFRTPGLVPVAVLIAYVMSFVFYWFAAWRIARPTVARVGT